MKPSALALIMAVGTLAALHAGAADAKSAPSHRFIYQLSVEVNATASRQPAITGQRSVPVTTQGHGQALANPSQARVAIPTRR